MNTFYQNMMINLMNYQMQMNQNNQMMPNGMPYMMQNVMQNNINQNQVQNEPFEIDVNFISLYGIQDPIKILKFKNVSNNKIYKATISQYFTKSDLYWLIKNYENNFILIYKDDVLENDESDIDDIPDGTTIDVYNKAKEGYHIKNLYYNYLLEKYKSSFKNIVFSDINGKSFSIYFPSNISISQMIKVLKFEFKYKDDAFYLYNDEKLKDNDNSKLSQKMYNSQNVRITIIDSSSLKCGFGTRKIIKAIILVKDKNIVKTTNVERFYSINYLISKIEDSINSKIKSLYIEDKQINLNNEKTIASLGIKDDFICTVEI